MTALTLAATAATTPGQPDHATTGAGRHRIRCDPPPRRRGRRPNTFKLRTKTSPCARAMHPVPFFRQALIEPTERRPLPVLCNAVGRVPPDRLFA